MSFFCCLLHRSGGETKKLKVHCTLHLHNRDVLMEEQVCLFPHLGSQTYERANNSRTVLVDKDKQADLQLLY